MPESTRAGGSRPGVYSVVFGLLRPYRLSLTVSLLLGVVATAASLAQPYVIGRIVSRAGHSTSVMPPLLVLLGLFAVGGLVGGVQVYLIVRAGASMALATRRTLARRLLRASMETHHENRRGDVFARAVADTSLLSLSLTQNLAQITMSVITVVATIVLMTVVDPLLTAVTGACVLIAITVAFVISRFLRLAAQDSRGKVGEFGVALQRALGAVATIKISRAEQREEERIGRGAEAAYAADLRVARLASLMNPAMNLGVQVSFAAVFTVGASLVAHHSIDIATFAAFVLYLLYLISPLFSCLTAFAQFSQALAAVTRVNELVTLPEEEDTAAGATPGEPGNSAAREPAEGERAGGAEVNGAHLDGAHGNGARLDAEDTVVAFEHVGFGYRADVPILRDVTFTVPRRGTVAIVGPSGSGKSTMFSLIERFWEVQEGRITLHGTDIRDMPRAVLRSRIAYVEQNAPVLDGTVRENLVLANPDATEEEISTVVRRLGLDAWIGGLRDGLDGQVGEEGTEISGGQRQRLAVARMLLADPEVLLLDEASSQLDTEAENALKEVIDLAARDRAVVVIAHRMSTVSDADRILVVDRGRLVAEGTHEGLLETSPEYRRLVHDRLAGPQAGQEIPAVPREPVGPAAATRAAADGASADELVRR